MIGWLRKLFPSDGADSRNVGSPASHGNRRASASAAPSTRRADAGEPFVINLYDDRAVVHRPDGQREEVSWDALERVIVRVSDRAPWAGTAWLILVGDGDSKQGCVVPLDAANHDALLTHLRAMPGFNEQKLDNALRDAEAGRARSDAILWKRSDAERAEAERAEAERAPARQAGDHHDPAANP
ncbi:hypothetical protein [Cupriavidus plantarum]|uniref:Uncharacterized protein n=1 Tax=Cupriavidus plantarum TaxID=942865 RepID=A0A316F201_9BURK|nr:hypothetical protein [Cupriavidus plantarum]PWK38476.1 hypothetical protein C7419_1012373 [Cupriavidus plantarum]